MSLGLSEDETSYPDKINDKVRELAAKFTDMSKNGLPLTIIVELLEQIEEKESVVDVYHALVDTLAISDKEKAVLHSIIQNKRSGTLTIFIAETLKELEKIKIPTFPEDNYPIYQVVQNLNGILNLFSDGAKIEISFTE
jgi:hypothetical protein